MFKFFFTLYVELCYLQYKPALDFLAYRESRNQWNVISPTLDYGKYQINHIHLNRWHIDKDNFLNDTTLQKYYAIKLMNEHKYYAEQWNIPFNTKTQIKSWSGIAYMLY